MPNKLEIARSQQLRLELLALLYDLRKTQGRRATACRRAIEDELGTRAIDFELDYLLEMGLIGGDGIRLAITATGIDYFEQEAK